MLLQKNQIIFIFLQLFIFIISSTRFNINLIRKLDESNSAEEANLNSSGLYGTNTTDEYFGDATYGGLDIVMTVTMPDGTQERHPLNKAFTWKSEQYVARTDGTVMKVKNKITLDTNKIFNVVYPDGSIKKGYLGQEINLYGRKFVIGQTGELVNPYTQSSIWNDIPREGQTYKVGTVLWIKKPDAASYMYAVVGDVFNIDGQKYKLQTDGKLQKYKV